MGARRSDAPEVPFEARQLINFGRSALRGILYDPARYQEFFGLTPPGGPSTLDLEAESALLRTFGAEGLGPITDTLRSLATSAPEDIDQYLRAIEARQGERLAADIKERFGNVGGTALSTGVAREVARGLTDLSERGLLARAQFREAGRARQVEAARVYGGLGATAGSALFAGGQIMREILERDFQRRYQDVLTRRFQIPLQVAQTATGGAGQIPFYQPTYGPGPLAGMLGGAATGASIAGAFNLGNPWTAGIVGASAILGGLG